MKKFIFDKQRWHNHDTMEFTNKISSLLQAGIPLIESMTIVANQFKGSKKKQLENIRARMISGTSVIESFKTYHFPYPFFSMLGIAQYHGKLADTFSKLSSWFEQKTTFRQKMYQKLIYPIFLLLFVIGISFYFILFLLPQFQTLLNDFDHELPFSTLLLLNIQDFFQNNFLSLLLIIGMLLLISVVFLTIMQKKKKLYLIFIKVPLIRGVIQVKFTYFFSSQLGLLLEAGMGIRDSLKEIHKNSIDQQFSSFISEIEHHVLQGKSLSSAQLSIPLLHHEYYLLTSLGEQLGTLGEQLIVCSKLMEKKIEAQVQFVIKWTEPILLLLLGLIITFVILSLFLPILQLIQSI